MRSKDGRFKTGHRGHWQGKEFTEEHRKSLSRARIGKKLSEETKRKIGETNKISQLGNKNGWRGGRTTDGNGYVKVYSPEHPNSNNCYVLEHRAVMEKEMGRALGKTEVVHHINGDKHDNRVENLVVFNNQREHKRFEGLLNKKCYEFVEAIGPEWIKSKGKLFEHLGYNPQDRE